MPEYTTSSAVYRLSGLTSADVASADVDAHIDEAERWVDRHLNTTFKSGGISVTETLDGTGTNVLFVSWHGNEYQDALPVLTVTALTIDGTSVTPSNLYVYKAIGKLILKDTAEVQQFTITRPQQVSVTYTYGHTAIPSVVKQMTALIAAMHAVVEKMGGSFQSVTSYSLPEYSVNKGDATSRLGQTAERLKQKLDWMLAEVRPAFVSAA